MPGESTTALISEISRRITEVTGAGENREALWLNLANAKALFGDAARQCGRHIDGG